MTSLFGQPTAYFDPPRGPLTFDATYSYSSFTSPTAIPFSATPSFIGLEAMGADGTHFGYAEFSGTELLSYASETVPGVGIPRRRAGPGAGDPRAPRHRPGRARPRSPPRPAAFAPDVKEGGEGPMRVRAML